MMHSLRPLLLQGTICDLVTPFANDRLDEAALARLIELQAESGITGLLGCGPTGEPWALSAAERARVISVCVETAGGRTPVVAGTGTNATETTIALTVTAKALGATAAYIVMPYYNKPSQEGVFRHYEAICRSVDLPIIIGLAPHRTAIDLAPRTLERLAGLSSIIGIDDGSGDVGKLSATPPALGRRFSFYAGQDMTAMSFNLAGGKGTISAAANIVPSRIVALNRAVADADLQTALMLQESLMPLFQALACEPAPPAIKYALSLLRGVSDEVRLPMTPIVAETAAAIRTALAPLLCGSMESRRKVQ